MNVIDLQPNLKKRKIELFTLFLKVLKEGNKTGNKIDLSFFMGRAPPFKTFF